MITIVGGNHDHLILLLVGVPLLFAICTFCTLAALRAAALEDASLDRLRHEGLGDPRAVPELDLSPYDPARRRAVVAETAARREAEERGWCMACWPAREREGKP